MAAKAAPSVKYLFLTGILLLVFGCIAIASPAMAGTSVVIVIGAILVVSGLAQIVHGLRESSFSSKLLPLVLGAITLIAGLAVLAHPFLGLTALTLALAVYFVVEGLWKIFISFSFRPAAGWLAMLGSGVITLALGAMIWKQWPVSGLWAIGALIGVDLALTGLALLLLAVTLRRIATAA